MTLRLRANSAKFSCKRLMGLAFLFLLIRVLGLAGSMAENNHDGEIEVWQQIDGQLICCFDCPTTASLREVLEYACRPGCGNSRQLKAVSVVVQVEALVSTCSPRPDGFESESESDETETEGSEMDHEQKAAKRPRVG